MKTNTTLKIVTIPLVALILMALASDASANIAICLVIF